MNLLSKLINNTITRYSVTISSMAVHMLAIFSLDSESAGIVAFSIYSLVIGLFAGDCNTVNFYRRHSVLKGQFFLIERSIMASIIIIILFITNLGTDVVFLIGGLIVGLLLPQGRVSNNKTFPQVVFLGGILKILISGAVCLVISDIFWMQILLATSTGSLYLASIYFQLQLIDKTSFDLHFRYHMFKSLTYSGLITIPIQIYTAVGALIYQNYNAAPNLGNFYQVERLLRGLGGTVLVLQSSTMYQISSAGSIYKAMKVTINNIFKYVVYSVAIGTTFAVFGLEILSFFDMNIISINFENFIFILLCCFAMYLTNLIGVQFLSVYKYTKMFILSVTVGASSFIVSNVYFSNPVLLISISELSVAFAQLFIISLISKSAKNYY